MRYFTSYGPIDTEEHYYVPREELIEMIYSRLLGNNPQKGGHYMTLWAPLQTGKTWLMKEVLLRIRKNQAKNFQVIKINLEDQKDKKNTSEVLQGIANKLGEELNKSFTGINNQENFQNIFKKEHLKKPLILILDEFDSLTEPAINSIVSAFRNIYITRDDEVDKSTEQKKYLLHSVALIGVRSVLGVENVKGSPFNVQQSVHIPNFSFSEVKNMFLWYSRESGQSIDHEVIRKLYEETGGQPGLTCWFGELLTKTFNKTEDQPNIKIKQFETVYESASLTLPNNNILNIISKVKKSPYKEWVMELFKTSGKVPFKIDDEYVNYLYMNGVIREERAQPAGYYVKFSCPFVQKRIFNYFSGTMFQYMGQLVEPFEKLEDAITESELNIRNLMKYYTRYLGSNRDWLLKEAPRRKDLRIYEAVFHFNLYMYLNAFLDPRGGKVYPEFPTGNGKIDLLIQYKNKIYGLELKSFTHETAYKDALKQAAQYGKKLRLQHISLIFFIETIDDANRKKYEKDHLDEATGVTVAPVFIPVAEKQS